MAVQLNPAVVPATDVRFNPVDTPSPHCWTVYMMTSMAIQLNPSVMPGTDVKFNPVDTPSPHCWTVYLMTSMAVQFNPEDSTASLDCVQYLELLDVPSALGSRGSNPLSPYSGP
jgi:hypothetical protein